MFRLCPNLVVIVLVLLSFGSASGQMDEICRESGFIPSLDSPFAQVPYIYGKITVNGVEAAKPLKITVIFSEGQQTEKRWTVGKSGAYCFKRTSGGGVLVVEVNGTEFARRTLPSFGSSQQREDFEVQAIEASRQIAPSTISAKFARPTNEKTVQLYKTIANAERDKQTDAVIAGLKEVTQIDAEDFIAWAKLGTVYFQANNLPEADAAFRRSLELRVDYTPAWINVGKLRMAQKQFDAAVEIFKHAATLEPDSARIYQLLGESYLFAKKGSLGAEMLNKAITLDPVGMAESHLLLATLYDRAGAKGLASREYRLFLEKVKDHPDRPKFEKYKKENPEAKSTN